MGYGMLGSCIKKIIIAVPFFFLSFFKFLGKCLWICEVCFVDECICFECQLGGLNLLLKYQYVFGAYWEAGILPLGEIRKLVAAKYIIRNLTVANLTNT